MVTNVGVIAFLKLLGLQFTINLQLKNVASPQKTCKRSPKNTNFLALDHSLMFKSQTGNQGRTGDVATKS